MGAWSRPTRVAALWGTVGLTSAALVVGMSPAAWGSPDNETIWEAGRVTRISDGDTLLANLTAGPGKRGVQRIRTIGVQAPEVSHGGSRPECGSANATARLRAQLPVGAAVQTRSVDVRSYDDRSGGRLVRSLYARDAEGNWYDTSRRTVSQGWLMWFPKSADSAKKPEWAHNLEYRVLADDAASQKRGLWSANLCGTNRYPSLKVRIWAKYWGTEQVWIENQGTAAIDLSRWIIRDAAISGYRTLPAGTVIPAGQAKLVYSGDLNLNNLPVDNAAFEGDAVYLMEPASAKLGTGNLRAWFPYPCNPDACTDPLQGKVTISKVRASAPPEQTPSAPGSVRAAASVDGTGRVTVSWAAATSPGSEKLSYIVTTRAVDGGAQPAAVTGITGTSRVIGGLTLGRAYEFTVRATNPVGRSAATAPTPAVSPIGLPTAPTAVRVEPQGTSAVLSWQAPAGISGEPAVRYAVTTRTAAGNGPGCATTSGATSCVLTGLAVDQVYSASVTATLGAQSLATAPVSFAARAAADGTDGLPGAPTGVNALAGSTRMVVGWTAPDQTTSGPVTRYVVTATPRGGGAQHTCATTGATSCVITGLTNGTHYTASVTATTATGSGPASAASPEVTPTTFVATRSSGPTAAPPVVANPWIGGEIVEVTNTSSQSVRLGGYGLWDVYSSTGGTDNRARYLFDANRTLAPKSTLLLHFGATPAYRPPAPAGRTWVWTGVAAFINATNDVVELSNLNQAPVSCVATPGGSCRAAREKSVSSPPVGVTAQAGANRVTVTWGAPISTGGAAITRYTASAHSAAVGGSVLGTCSTVGSGRSCSIAGRIGTRYYVDVVARNAQGVSGPSWRVFAAPRTVPGAPARVVVGSTPGGLNVRWTPAAPNGAPVTRYTAAAYAAATGGSAVASCTTTTGTMTGCTIPGLRQGTRYHVQVRATNRAGLGQPNTPRVAGTPGVGRAVSTLSGRRVAVRWDAAALPAAGVTGYTARVYSKASGGSLLGSCTAGPTALGCLTGTLTKRSKYYIEVATHTASGSFTNLPRIVTGKPKKPGKPKVTAATPAATKRVTVRWTPGSTGYLPATRFQAALYTKSKKGAVRGSCLAAGTSVACATTAVPKGTYYAAVRTANAKGWSPWSKRVKVRVR